MLQISPSIAALLLALALTSCRATGAAPLPEHRLGLGHLGLMWIDGARSSDNGLATQERDRTAGEARIGLFIADQAEVGGFYRVQAQGLNQGRKDHYGAYLRGYLASQTLLQPWLEVEAGLGQYTDQASLPFVGGTIGCSYFLNAFGAVDVGYRVNFAEDQAADHVDQAMVLGISIYL